MPEKHADEGILWSVDNGVLTIDLAPGGNGSIPMHNTTETYTHYTEVDSDEVYSDERERVLGYQTPWAERTNEIVEVRIGEGITSIP